MTEVSKMTDQQLNRALAELMGYSVYHYDKDVEQNCYYMLMDKDFDPVAIGWGQGERKTECEAWSDAPAYCTDPAASLEVQAYAIAKNEEGYVQRLADVVGANGFWDGMYGDMAPTGIAWLLTATPRQRAEAAYFTLRGDGT